MRILFVHNSLPEYRVSWFRNLSKQSNCTFLITNPQVAEHIYKYDGKKYIDENENCTFLSNGYAGYREFFSFLVDMPYDFVELPPVDSMGELFKSLILLCKAKRRGIKTGYFWEKWEAPKEFQPLGRRIKNFLLDKAAYFVYKRVDIIFSSGSKNREYFLSRGVSRKKVHWIPDCCEIPYCDYINIREKYKIPKDATLFLYFGRVIKQKGLDVLIRAFKKLKKEKKQKAFLLIAGDGDFKASCEKLVDKTVVDKVLFIGAVEPHMRYNFFSQCDVFVHPGTFYKGRTDVWGLTLNEAVQCGKIIISTNAVGSAYDLINKCNGFMIQERNIEQLKNAMEQCVGNRELQESAKEENEKIYQIYNSSNMATQYIDVVKRAIR